MKHLPNMDSVADICFLVCCAIRLLPVLRLPTWLWIWAGVIVIIKIINQVTAWVISKRFCFPHTRANKLTGFLLFLLVPTVFRSIVPIAIVAGLATFAAIQEGHFKNTKTGQKMFLYLTGKESIICFTYDGELYVVDDWRQ